MAPNESLYGCCERILGHDCGHRRFEELCDRLQHSPEIVAENEHVSYFDFPEKGIELVYSKRRCCFTAIIFFVKTPHIGKRGMRPYSEPLLFGVELNDTLETIAQKIKHVSVRSQLQNERTLRYSFGLRDLSFYFDGSGQQLRFFMLKLRTNGRVGDESVLAAPTLD